MTAPSDINFELQHCVSARIAFLRGAIAEPFAWAAVEVAGEPVAVVKHAYTHFRITLHAFECRVLSGKPQATGVADFKWVRMSEIDRYAFAVTDRKIIQALGDA